MALSIGGYSNSIYGGFGAGNDAAKPLENGKSEETTKKPGRRSSPAECETCKHRKYVDGSNEGNVSYKTPTHIDPSAAAGAVASHEGMHVHNAYAKASKEGGRVLQASVSIHTAVCPECGRVYVSGGTTTTRIAAPVSNGADTSSVSHIFSTSNNSNPYRANEGSLNSILNSGKSLNAAV